MYTNKTLVMILCMHRSGSSFLANALQQLGMSLGPFPLLGAHASNPHGHFESLPVLDLDRQLQAELLGFPDVAPESPEQLQRFVESDGQWLPNAAPSEQAVRRGQELLAQFFQTADVCGVKDPRVALLWPFWKQAIAGFPGLRLVPLFLFRSPHEIAMSLFMRDGRRYLDALDVTAVHFANMLAVMKSCQKERIEYGLVHFDGQRLEEDLRNAARLCGLPWQDQAIKEVYDRECKHHEQAAVVHRAQSLFDRMAKATGVTAASTDTASRLQRDAALREDAMRQRIAAFQDEAKRLKDEVARGTAELLSVKQEAAQRTEKLSHLEADAAPKNELLSRLTAEVSRLDAEARQRSEEASRLRNELAQKTADLAILRERLARIETFPLIRCGLRLRHNARRLRGLAGRASNTLLREGPRAFCEKGARNLRQALPRLRNGRLNLDREGRRRRDPSLPRVTFLLPTLCVGGGVAVVLQYAHRLQALGHDVTVLTNDDIPKCDWFPYHSFRIEGISKARADAHDILVATFWATAPVVQSMNAARKFYFVQSDESRFYPGNEELQQSVLQTYRLDMEMLTVAKWLQRWLKERFNRHAHYLPNGIDRSLFHPAEPLAAKGARPRVLLEGTIDVPFKGMKNAFRAVKNVDCDVWCVSSVGKPEPDWHCDRFLGPVPHGQMKNVYSSCDVLLKMSEVESFCLPPLEMMACGQGACVIGEVTGTEEYAEDGVNALMVKKGDVEGARHSVQRLLDEPDLRQYLIENGLKTVQRFDWDNLTSQLHEIFCSAPVKTA